MNLILMHKIDLSASVRIKAFTTLLHITALTSKTSSGKFMAIEGDIEAAYDTVDKDKLINILGELIADRKFLKLIRERLDYDYVEQTNEGWKRYKPKLGIPQGGIDSPYLFNIYMKIYEKTRRLRTHRYQKLH
jgi:retron-type reverse transcriptase